MTSRIDLPDDVIGTIPEQPCVGRVNDPEGGHICMRILLNLCSLREAPPPNEMLDKRRQILGLNFAEAPRSLCNCLKIKPANTLYLARTSDPPQWREIPTVWVDRKPLNLASAGFPPEITDPELELNNLLTEIINMELVMSEFDLNERELEFEAHTYAKIYRDWLCRSVHYNGNPQYLYPINMYRLGFRSWHVGDTAVPVRDPQSFPQSIKVGNNRHEALRNYFHQL